MVPEKYLFDSDPTQSIEWSPYKDPEDPTAPTNNFDRFQGTYLGDADGEDGEKGGGNIQIHCPGE